MFITSIIVAVITIIGIWIFGVGSKRTLFENSLISTSILSVAFFSFLTINLYKGIKLKDDLGKITDRINRKNIPDFSGLDFSGADMPSIGDGIGGIILGIISWFLISIVLVLVFVITFFGTIFWFAILIFAAMLYWIFFRALRLVFKNSNKTKGKILQSVSYALLYTIIYNFWIYGIILMSHYFLK